MPNAPKGLSDKDIQILQQYAREKNRELYWNYLAQLPSNDGYSLLALGVVRNDNMPGATANSYAKNYAMEHSDIVMSEHQWDQFGARLMQHDLEKRLAWAASADYSEFSLNLPARQVMKVHDETFGDYNIDPNAWTPRKLLMAAHERDVEEQRLIERGDMRPEDASHHMESRWSAMLDNGYAGVQRMASTTIRSTMDRIDLAPDLRTPI
ncbi:MAG: hypothetical protein GAK28_04724 [Luteibacter sp.]|uniref:hypothetical protein n=1 Tax=Luteibacter sp. TaxID=1886636 RepID=UPI001382B789|nr:hypothetical protein [Luteibacter sp.]KAF1003438.1 MAG: hypothetical protein GAK28_04724 [Luteibacter sp.]